MVDLALLILRVFIGVALMLHGYGKIGRVHAFAATFNLPSSVAGAVVFTQLLGGAMLAGGLLTSVAGIGIAMTMVGAIVKCLARGERFVDPEHHSWESAGFYLVASVAIAMLGPGVYSLDGLFGRWH